MVHPFSDVGRGHGRAPGGVRAGRRMIAMSIARVADVTGAEIVPPAEGFDPAATAAVTSVEFDSRQARPGTLFVALRGERVDGHGFAAAAAAAGAVAVVGSAPIDAPVPLLRLADDDAVLEALAALARASVTALVRDHGLQVVGVTGSSGKTSTKDLIAAVLRAGVAAAPGDPPRTVEDGAGRRGAGRRGGHRPARIVQQRARPPLHGAASHRAHAVPGARAVRQGHRPHRDAGPDRAAADRRRAERRLRAHRRVRLGRGHRRREVRTGAGTCRRPAPAGWRC